MRNRTIPRSFACLCLVSIAALPNFSCSSGSQPPHDQPSPQAQPEPTPPPPPPPSEAPPPPKTHPVHGIKKPPTAATRPAPSVNLSAVDEILRQLPTGNIAFNVPDTMVMGRTYGIHLVLSPRKSIQDLQAELQQKVEGHDELQGATVSIAPEMEARLTGQDFKIDAVTPERQAVSNERGTDWQWDISATKQGNQELHLTLNVILTVNGASLPHSLQTFDRRITVRVTWGQRLSGFIGTNWQWLWTVLVVPLAAWIWQALKKRKRA